jgi:hypothetical protein
MKRPLSVMKESHSSLRARAMPLAILGNRKRVRRRRRCVVIHLETTALSTAAEHDQGELMDLGCSVKRQDHGRALATSAANAAGVRATRTLVELSAVAHDGDQDPKRRAGASTACADASVVDVADFDRAGGHSGQHPADISHDRVNGALRGCGCAPTGATGSRDECPRGPSAHSPR